MKIRHARHVKLLSLLGALVAFATLLPAAAAAQGDALDKAYQKEFTYLEAQKRALETRLDDLQKKNALKVTSAQAEIDRLQGRLLSMQREANKLETELLDAERDAVAISDDADVLSTTLDQARASLKSLEVEIEEVPDNKEDPEGVQLARAKKLDEAFAEVFAEIDKLQGIQTLDNAPFFLADGTKVTGTIIKIGNIAAFGITDDEAGAMAPAGDGRLKLWSAPAEATAKGFASGSPPESIGIFLYESLTKNVEEKKEQTWVETIELGGPTGWTIVFLGVLGLILVLVRVLILTLASTGAGSLVENLEPLVKDREFEQAAALAEKNRSALGRVLAATTGALERPREELEDVVSEALLRESPSLERFGSAIAVFAAVAPLLGLLGTVTGMISTFDIITEFGTGDPKMLSGGISVALITTQLGLIVAIPLLLLGNLTNGMANSTLTKLERAALHIINLVDWPEERAAEPNVAETDGTMEVRG
ncbi:MAG: MotA/TolQ/ExbB proton channel family protein [Myxococcota bacterium]